MFESLKLSDINENNCVYLRRPNSTSPAVWRIETRGKRAVIKDFRFNGFFFRNIVGRFLIWREVKAYRRLKNLEGVPSFCRSMDGIALVMEEIQGRNIEQLEAASELSEQFYSDLRSLIDRFHDRGLAHCDLKRAPNIMLGENGKPYIVDWAASISEREFRFFPFSLVYKRFLQDDLNAITKLKLKCAPERVTEEEKSQYMERSRAEIAVRKIKNRIKDFLTKVA